MTLETAEIKKSWFAWIVLGIIIGVFILVSSYVFNWTVNWNLLGDWANSSWFGLVLLLIIAAIVSWRITK